MLSFAKILKIGLSYPQKPVVIGEALAAAVVIQASAMECDLREDNGETAIELTSLELDVTDHIAPYRKCSIAPSTS